MRRTFKRVLSFALAVCVLSSVVPTAVFAADDAEATVWDATHITEFTDDESSNGVVYFGTQRVSAEERGKYILTLCRDGNTDEAAEVTLGTIDISAAYGEDYRILDEDTEYRDLGGTVMERNADVDEEQMWSDYAEQYNEFIEAAAEAEKEDEDNKAGEADKADEGGSASQSALAQIKKEQTGIPTRELKGSSASGGMGFLADIFECGEAWDDDSSAAADEYEGSEETAEELLKYTENHIGDFAETSSDTKVKFDAGETEKQIVIEVIKDNEAEGDEYVMFALSSPDGAEIGDLNTCTMTIIDDEESEESYLSFASAEFELDGENNTIKLVRTGAEYSLISATVTLSGGATKEVYVKPFKTEIEISMDISGYGVETVTMGDFKGCSAGDITECTVTYSETDSQAINAAEDTSVSMAASATSAPSKSTGSYFELNGINGHSSDHKLRVYTNKVKTEPVTGHLYGDIIDPGYSSDVVVGRYYYAKSFSYGLYSGAEKHTSRSSKFLNKTPDDPTCGYGDLQWYNWYTRRMGSSYAELNDVNAQRYAFFGIDWEQSRKAYGGQRSKFAVFNSSGQTTASYIMPNQFSRTFTNIGARNTDKLPFSDNGAKVSLKVYAMDEQKNRTPKLHVMFYGAAAMYRRFAITLNNPGKMTFANGSEEVTALPCSPSLGDGHESRYVDQYLNINESSVRQDGLITGELIGYKIETDWDADAEEKRKTFYYMAQGHTPSESRSGDGSVTANTNVYYTENDLTNFQFDDEFLSYVDANLAGVANDSTTDWYTTLSFTPLFKYKDVKVQIGSSDLGTFSDEKLAAGSTLDYHVGDTLELAGTPINDNYVFSGYAIEARRTDNKNDTKLINENQLSDEGQALYLTLGEKNCAYYQLTPLFKKRTGNYIKLAKGDNSENLSFMNVLTSDQIKIINSEYPDYMLGEDDLIYIANTDIDESDYGTGDAELARKYIDMITVKPGAVYQLQVVPKDGSGYVPQYTNSCVYGDKTITGYELDFIASTDLSNNVIKVSAAKRGDGEAKIIRLDGQIVSAGYSVRQTAQTEQSMGMQNMNVYGGGTLDEMWLTPSGAAEAEKTSCVNRLSAVTDENGYFSISGIEAAPSDVVTLYYSNGDAAGIKIIDLSQLTSTEENVTYSKIVPDDTDKTNGVEQCTVSGLRYDMTGDEIVTPAFNQGSPYVTSVTYNYSKSANQAQYTSLYNNVAICDDCLTVTANVNPNGRTLKKVVFTLDKKQSASVDYTVDAKEGQTEFRCEFDGKSMNEVIDSGDKLYITLYDAENTVIKIPYVDKDGNNCYKETTKETIYTKVFTGLEFYLPTVDTVSQVYAVNDAPTEISIDAPLLGETAVNSTTGRLDYTKNDWDKSKTGIDGYSLTFYSNLSMMDTSESSVQDVLSKVKDYANNANTRAQSGNWSSSSAITQSSGSFQPAANSLNEVFRKNVIGLQVVVLLNFDFAYNSDTGKYYFVGGQVAIGGSFEVSRVFYTVLGVVPIYVRFTGGVAAEIQANYIKDKNLTADKFSQYENLKNALTKTKEDGKNNEGVGLFFALDVKMEPGVGICGVLGARGMINARMDSFTAFSSDIKEKSGVKGTFSGGIYLDLLLFSIGYKVNIATLGAGIYKDVTASEDSVNAAGIEDIFDNVEVRYYDMGGGEQVGGGDSDLFASELTDYTVLLNDAPERTRPQIIELSDGKKMLVYIGNNSSRELDANKPCLYYSIYDGSSWSTAQPVEDDGTADSTPALAKYGNEVIVVWSDASREFTGDDTENGILSLFDITAVRFDPDTGVFGDVTKLSDDRSNYDGAFIDFAPIICSDPNGQNDIAVCYLKRDPSTVSTVSDVLDMSSVYETVVMTVWTKDGEVKSERFPQIDGDPYITSFDAIFKEIPINGEQHPFAVFTYAADTDNDLNTSDDWDIYLCLSDLSTGDFYSPINISEGYPADTQPTLTEIDGDIYLTWIMRGSDDDSDDGISDFNSFNVSGMLENMAGVESGDDDADYTVDLGLVFDGSADWYKKTAQQLGLTDEQYENSIYAELSGGNIPINSYNLSIDNNTDIGFGEYTLLGGADGNTYLIWTESGSKDEDDYSVELYGAVKCETDDTDTQSGWSSAVKISDFASTVAPNVAIDEFDAAVAEDGTFDIVSNMYTQNMNDDGTVEYSENKLIEFTFDNSAEVQIDGLDFDDDYPAAGSEQNLYAQVTNNGLLTLEGFEATAYIDGVEFGRTTVTEPLLGGNTTFVQISGIMPTELASGEKVTITVTPTSGTAVSYEQDMPIGADIVFEDGELTENENGELVYTVTVLNDGNATSGDFNVEARRYLDCNDEDAGLCDATTTFAATSLEAGEEREIAFVLDSATLTKTDFDAFGYAELNLRAVSGETQIGQNDMKLCYDEYKESITLNGNTVSISVTNGSSMRLEASKTPALGGETYTYSVADTSVASVDNNGYITGNKVGTTEITVTETSSGLTKTFTVDVVDATEATPTPEPTATTRPSSGGGRRSGRSGTAATATPTATVSPTPSPTATAASGDTSLPFTDVFQDDWYYDGVMYAYDNGLMDGTSSTEFSPSMPLTRGMLVTVLGRAEGVDDTVPAETEFTDVDANAYYAPYIAWAAENGIVDGMGDGTFAPDEYLTREQMAKIFFGYYNYKGEGPSGAWAIHLDYSDTDKISDWAVEGVMFCTMKGLMQGKDNDMFDPTGNTKRCELAAVLMRAGLAAGS